MILVIDASVAMRWYHPDAGFSAARAILVDHAERNNELLAPDLIVPEFLNLLWERVMRGKCSVSEAQQIRELWGDMHPDLLASSAFAARALHLATSLRHSLYGCLYLAAAVELRAPLVTADRRLARVAMPLLPEVQLLH